MAVDRRLVEAAALLHDVDKALPAGRSGARPPPRRRLGGLADPARAPRAGPGRGRPPGDAAPRRRGATGAGRRSRPARSGSSPTPTSAPASASSRWTRGSPSGGGATRGSIADGLDARLGRRRAQASGRAPTGSRPTSAGPPASSPPRSAGWRWTGARSVRLAARDARMTTSPLAYFWGDDDLSASRARRSASRRRWRPRAARRSSAGTCVAIGTPRRASSRELHERVATPVMFGGGTLAVVLNAGRSSSRARTADAFLAVLEARRAGQRPGRSSTRASRGRRHPRPSAWPMRSRRPAGTVRRLQVAARGRARRLDRARGARARASGLGPGAAKTLAERVGGFVREGDVERDVPDPDRLDGARQARALPRRRRRSTPTTSGRSSPRRSRARSGRSPTRSASVESRAPSSCSIGCSTPPRSRSSSPCSIDGSASCSRRAIAWRAGERLAGRRQGDGHRERVPDAERCATRRRPGRRTSWSTRSTGWSSSTRWSRACRARSGTTRSDAWRSRCG